MAICKNTLVAIALLLVFLCASSCHSSETTPQNDDLTDYQKDVIAYFKDVALGFEFGNNTQVTRKWDTDMKIFVGGDSPELESELADIIAELNTLATDQFDISITTDTLQSNCYLFFGKGEDFADVYPGASSDIDSNWGLFYVFYNGSEHLYNAVVYVDIFRTTDANARKHLLREELTQSLGLARDSDEYPESIFQAQWTTVTEYAPIDRDLIRLLYHPDMQTGLNVSQVDPLLRQLVVELNIGE